MNKIRIRKKIRINHYPILWGNILLFLAYSVFFCSYLAFIPLMITYLIQFLFCTFFSIRIKHRSVRESKSWNLSGMLVLVMGLILSILLFIIPNPQTKTPENPVLEENSRDTIRIGSINF